MTPRKASSVACRSGPPDDAPALLTQTSTRPKRSSVVATSRATVVVVGDVAAERAAMLRPVGELLEPVEPARRGDDLGAGVGEHGREARAEPARGAGHDRDLARRVRASGIPEVNTV